MDPFTILINGEEKAHGLSGKEALALINAFAHEGDGTTEITARLERSDARSRTLFEPREVK